MSTDTPLEQRMLEVAKEFDFECTEADDHDYPAAECPKCRGMRYRLAALLTKEVKAARLDEARLRGHDESCIEGLCLCGLDERIRELEANK